MKINEEFTIYIGKYDNIGKNRDVIYAGIVNKNVFSIVHNQNGPYANASIGNFYFQRNAKTINIEDDFFEVKKITPTQLKLVYLGKKKLAEIMAEEDKVEELAGKNSIMTSEIRR
jgi:hypothetical protein